ncbi:MAG: hypothetical protein LBL38_02610 [Lactobacillales bacterium]|jgi:DNA polymerase III epsilon subunit-like protein|nr:hypothetical protein [Lactobacillales bacterium]
MKVAEKIYAAVDLKTTAPRHKGARIIQIGIVLIKNDKIISTFMTNINPRQEIYKSFKKNFKKQTY